MPISRYLSIFTVCAALAVPSFAAAQTTASPAPAASSAPAMSGHHGRHHRHSWMSRLRSLNLTDAQKQQVATFRAQREQADQNADPATKRTNAAKMRDQIMGILTPDQKSQLAAQHHHPHGEAPSPTASPATQ